MASDSSALFWLSSTRWPPGSVTRTRSGSSPASMSPSACLRSWAGIAWWAARSATRLSSVGASRKVSRAARQRPVESGRPLSRSTVSRTSPSSISGVSELCGSANRHDARKVAEPWAPSGGGGGHPAGRQSLGELLHRHQAPAVDHPVGVHHRVGEVVRGSVVDEGMPPGTLDPLALHGTPGASVHRHEAHAGRAATGEGCRGGPSWPVVGNVPGDDRPREPPLRRGSRGHGRDKEGGDTGGGSINSRAGGATCRTAGPSRCRCRRCRPQ